MTNEFASGNARILCPLRTGSLDTFVRSGVLALFFFFPRPRRPFVSAERRVSRSNFHRRLIFAPRVFLFRALSCESARSRTVFFFFSSSSFFLLEYASPTLWPFQRCPSSCPISSAKQRLPFFTPVATRLKLFLPVRASSRFIKDGPGFLNRREDIHVLGGHVISCTSARVEN